MDPRLILEKLSMTATAGAHYNWELFPVRMTGSSNETRICAARAAREGSYADRDRRSYRGAHGGGLRAPGAVRPAADSTLGAQSSGEGGDDLLQTALCDLLQDTRRWDKAKVGFMGFLFGAMKSISSNWAKSYLPEEVPVLDADLRKNNEEGEEFSPLDRRSAPQPTAEQQLSDRQTLGEVDNLFKDDQEAQLVLTAWQEGYDPAGVRELWGLSQNAYNTIVRRIRRTLDASDIKPDGDRGGTYVQ
jgi:hypothetical protein